MRNWLLRWVSSGIALAVVAHLGIGVWAESTSALVLATVVIGLANSLVRPFLVLLTLPLTCATFGLFGYAINALLFWATTRVVDGFHVDSVLGAVLGPILMGLVSGVLNHFLQDHRKDH